MEYSSLSSQFESLETILGGLRNSGSRFYSEPGMGGAGDGRSKQGVCLEDNMHGRKAAGADLPCVLRPAVCQLSNYNQQMP